MLTLLLTLLHADAAPTVHRLSRQFTNVYAIVGDEGVVLVDAHYPDRAEWILKSLEKQGLSASNVRLLVLTHGHSDHAGSAAIFQAAGIPVAVGAADAAMTEAGDHGEPIPTGLRGRILQPTLDPNFPAFTPDVLLEDVLDLSAYGIAGRVEIVGGHSGGSAAVVLDDGRIFVGDLIRGRFICRKRPTLHFFHESIDTAHASLTELLDAGAVEVLPGHGGPLSVKRTRRWLERHP
ncbi:MAG: hydroxyacylglutathione hydrolase [Myxococcota bacterium]|jgi:hydroxyacylglutathione hydrolase